MQSDLPKQFMVIGGKPVLVHAKEAFEHAMPNINFIFVLPDNFRNNWPYDVEYPEFFHDAVIAKGGPTRFHSVKNGLQLIKEKGLVAIHDGIRPFVSKSLIRNGFDTAKKFGNAVPAIDINDSVRKLEQDFSYSVNRSHYKLVQTPQCFQTDVIKKAYLQNYDEKFTDDASVLENTGTKINLIKGDPKNIKITTPFDLDLTEALLKNYTTGNIYN